MAIGWAVAQAFAAEKVPPHYAREATRACVYAGAAQRAALVAVTAQCVRVVPSQARGYADIVGSL